jgi:UDPglucose 6-dehydrogenase
MRILAAADAVNNSQPHRFVETIRSHFQGVLQGKRMTVWGLSFKPRNGDMRDAPSIKIRLSSADAIFTILCTCNNWGSRITA